MVEMMIDANVIERLKRDRRVLALYAQGTDLKQVGKELVGLCPFHDDSTPSLTINEKDGQFLFMCFGCNASGNIFQFLEKKEGLSFEAAVAEVQAFIDKDAWERDKKIVESNIQKLGNKEGKKVSREEYSKLEAALLSSPEGIEALGKRHIGMETAKKLHVGFKRDVGNRAKEDPDAAGAGWLSFPTIEGDFITDIKYRSIIKKAFCKQPGMNPGWFNGNSVTPLRDVYVTEGEFDALTLEQAGFTAVSISSATAKISPEMKDVLKIAKRVILAGDTDAPGNESKDRLFKELAGETYILHWPEGSKDANDFFVGTCEGNIDTFRDKVSGLTDMALAMVMPGIYSVQEAMTSGTGVPGKNNPLRLHMPWDSIDRMAVLLPGSVMTFSSSSTGQGKTPFVTQISVDAATKHNEVVLNFQVELDVAQITEIIAAQLTRIRRNSIAEPERARARTLLGDARYYIGQTVGISRAKDVLDLIEAAIRRLSATLVILDHLHFLCTSSDPTREESDAMQRIKKMAQNYGVKFIVVAQPRKPSDKNKGRELELSDFKGSESITSTADAVFALHRNTLEDDIDGNIYSPETRLKLLKVRSKGEGMSSSRLMFDGDLATFTEISFKHQHQQSAF